MSNTKNGNTLYINTIVQNSACGRHSAMTKMACFHIRKDDGGEAIGVCDFRAKKFFNGKISASSVKKAGSAPRFAKQRGGKK